MERNSFSAFARASSSRAVHFERIMSCDTCFTRDFGDPAPLNSGPVSVLEIVKELDRLSYVAYGPYLRPTFLTVACQTVYSLLKVTV